MGRATAADLRQRWLQEGMAAGEAGSARRCRLGRGAVPAGEGRRGALSFHCWPVLLHRPSLCQPSEWEPCLPAAPLLIRASAAARPPSASLPPPLLNPLT